MTFKSQVVSIDRLYLHPAKIMFFARCNYNDMTGRTELPSHIGRCDDDRGIACEVSSVFFWK